MRRSRNLQIAFACMALFGLVGCSAPGVSADTQKTPASTAKAPEPTPSASASTASDLGEAFAERDAFLQAQQLPLDGSPLIATTPAQKQFIEQQRQIVEQNGGTFDGQWESITLALTSDGCETSILNGHALDAELLKTHVATAQLIQALIPPEASAEERTDYEAGLVRVIVQGTEFMCPADHEQWEAAFAGVYGG